MPAKLVTWACVWVTGKGKGGIQAVNAAEKLKHTRKQATLEAPPTEATNGPHHDVIDEPSAVDE